MNLKQTAFVLTASILITACDDDIDYHVGVDPHHLRIYKDDQQLSCQPDSGISIRSHALELAEQNITMHCSQKGTDGFSYPQSCGSETGSINIYTIHTEDLAAAKALGFERLSKLPQASLNNLCEYQVISDQRKYYLMHDIKANLDIWQQAQINDYHYKIQTAYQDCSENSKNGHFRVQVENGQITEVMDLADNSILNDIDDFYTMEELLNEIKLSFWMSPFAAGKSVQEVQKLPHYSELGVIQSVYYDSGTSACDAPYIQISEFTPLN
ncbi:DUF6174 domain-containing protein [Gayadomonas joobiniege]|uniref:DUF6174 domain-containing protein n=1 Tax=Gayadomonas joobiniege TaxID=1234606 RepID=UPI000373753C|nr:DUF6174 domain-containing protein [Gayadomonas joobiniege]